jgi:hypothetical protein
MNTAFETLAVITILAAVSRPASSQTGLGQIGPTNAEVAGVVVAAGAVVAVTAVVLYATLHKQSITGCTRSVDGIASLTDEKDNLTYTLVNGESKLHPGERVTLRGKNKKDKSGNRMFKVSKIQHDYGPCQQ